MQPMPIYRFAGLTLVLAAACSSPPTMTTAIANPAQSPAPAATAVTPTLDASARNIWIQRASMPSARSEMPAVELNGLIYVPGGFGRRPDGLANGYGPVTSFDVYNPTTNTW